MMKVTACVSFVVLALTVAVEMAFADPVLPRPLPTHFPIPHPTATPTSLPTPFPTATPMPTPTSTATPTPEVPTSKSAQAVSFFFVNRFAASNSLFQNQDLYTASFTNMAQSNGSGQEPVLTVYISWTDGSTTIVKKGWDFRAGVSVSQSAKNAAMVSQLQSCVSMAAVMGGLRTVGNNTVGTPVSGSALDGFAIRVGFPAGAFLSGDSDLNRSDYVHLNLPDNGYVTCGSRL